VTRSFLRGSVGNARVASGICDDISLSVSFSLSLSVSFFLSLSLSLALSLALSDSRDKEKYALRANFAIMNVAHIRQSRPDPGLDFQVKVLTTFLCVPSSLGGGGTSRVVSELCDACSPSLFLSLFLSLSLSVSLSISLSLSLTKGTRERTR